MNKELLNKYFFSIDLEKQNKDWLRMEIKYGTSCPYCGLPSDKPHEECRRDI